MNSGIIASSRVRFGIAPEPLWVLKDNSWKMEGFWISDKLWTL